MAVLPADPPRRVGRRLAPDAAERDRRRVGGDGGARRVDTQIRARPPVRLIRPVAHPRRRRRGGRGHPERQRPVADRDGQPVARRGGRGGGGHPDRRRPDAGGSRAAAAHGFFLLGGSCQIELLVGPFNCEQRARGEKPAAGPGVPLQIPAVIAQRHGLQLGDELRIPGLPPGSAHLGWTFPEFDRVEGINDGYVLFAPSADIAASMLSSPGYATAAFVLPRPGADITADVDRVIAGVATAGPPRPHLPAIFEGATQSLNLTALAGIIIGVLIAVNTILLAVEDRRAVMGTIGAIGAKPVGLFGGMLGEGAVVGLLGGLLGVPSGFLFGTYLVDRFGRSMLAGSGGTITAHFTPNLIGIGAAAGIVCGIIAMIGPAARLLRDGPLASMASVGGVQRARKIPMWPLFVGVACWRVPSS